MSKRAYKTYTKEFKVEAIRLADQSDQPMTQVARKLGLRVNQIYKWPKQLEEKQGNAFSGKQTATDKDTEIQRLNKALAASQEENEFLKKTAVFFAKNQSWGMQRFTAVASNTRFGWCVEQSVSLVAVITNG